MDEKITESSGNVFIDLGFPPDEAAVLAMRSRLMCELEILIAENKWTQAEAAQRLGIDNHAFPIWCAASGKSSAWICW